ncbi:MAG: hypothetical protein HKN14_01580 [Marinicaulis sp.]|nr:hypothetical protein [Marinicaulis sp.]NNE39588.1 hypothetical protein [Marinicaulis sp.]NNL88466.1 hypothetical protein [Marinicaulis sp.]
MNDLDRQIEEALDAEDRALHREFGEQGLYAQWFGVYRGKQAWIAIIVTIVSFVAAMIAFYSIYRAVGAGDFDTAAPWAAAATVLLLMVSFMKIWFWMRMESNRVIREVKRLELQIARLNMARAA